MTEEKGCKNCDALGIDSEIGVYYCCLSHRQDDLPKEFICDDYIPNKQLKRLEQQNKELKQRLSEIGKNWGEIEELRKQVEAQKGLITVGGKQQYELTMAYDKLKTALEEISNLIDKIHYRPVAKMKEIQELIKKVLNP